MRRILQAAVGAMVPALVCIASDPASAATTHQTTTPAVTAALSWPSSEVTWKNSATGNCLQSGGSAYYVGSSGNANTSSCTTWLGVTEQDAYWWDPSLGGGLHYELDAATYNGSGAVNTNSDCLDSNYSGYVYVDPCNQGNYQKWLELSTATGWALQDYETGLWLDGGSGGYGHGVYTYSNEGDSDAYQRWH